MTPDPNRPRRKKIVLPAEVAEAMGMSEAERLDMANGMYFTIDDLLRELEAESGPGEDEPPKPAPEPRPES